MTYIVNCDRCDYRVETESYERAKDKSYHHHIPTGHNPVIEES